MEVRWEEEADSRGRKTARLAAVARHKKGQSDAQGVGEEARDQDTAHCYTPQRDIRPLMARKRSQARRTDTDSTAEGEKTGTTPSLDTTGEECGKRVATEEVATSQRSLAPTPDSPPVEHQRTVSDEQSHTDKWRRCGQWSTLCCRLIDFAGVVLDPPEFVRKPLLSPFAEGEERVTSATFASARNCREGKAILQQLAAVHSEFVNTVNVLLASESHRQLLLEENVFVSVICTQLWFESSFYAFGDLPCVFDWDALHQLTLPGQPAGVRSAREDVVSAFFGPIFQAFQPQRVLDSVTILPAFAAISACKFPSMSDHINTLVPFFLNVFDNCPVSLQLEALYCLSHFLNETEASAITSRRLHSVFLNAVGSMRFRSSAAIVTAFWPVYTKLLVLAEPHPDMKEESVFDDAWEAYLTFLPYEQNPVKLQAFALAGIHLVKATHLGAVQYTSSLLPIIRRMLGSVGDAAPSLHRRAVDLLRVFLDHTSAFSAPSKTKMLLEISDDAEKWDDSGSVTIDEVQGLIMAHLPKHTQAEWEPPL